MVTKKRSSARPGIARRGAVPPITTVHEWGPTEAVIETIGPSGRGVTRIEGSTVHIPFVLPGERVVARGRGTKGAAVEIKERSNERVLPICKHFGTCGSCSLQHWQETSYAKWKEDLVRSALAFAGVEAVAGPIKSYPVAGRRRATFTASKAMGELEFGYNIAQSHDLVDLSECPILLPSLAAALPHLKAAMTLALPKRSEAKVHVTAAANGIDCVIEAPALQAAAQEKLIHAFDAAGIIRAVWNADVIFQRASPVIVFDRVHVALPPGAFLQADAACQADMAHFVSEALAGAKVGNGNICDLFAGLGAFTFPAARVAPVTAYEADNAAVSALQEAARTAKGVKKVEAVTRDLFRNPLGPIELNTFKAVILDPPREGAEAQCKAIAASKQETVVMLSCNPTSFARDAAILKNGGFSIVRLNVFDQFRFSTHVEIAGLFVREPSKKGRQMSALRF